MRKYAAKVFTFHKIPVTFFIERGRAYGSKDSNTSEQNVRGAVKTRIQILQICIHT